MMRSAQIGLVLIGTLFVALGAACGRKSSEPTQSKSSAQAKESASPKERSAPAIKNFLANPTDNKGQRFVVRGDNAALLSKELYSITNIFIQTERNGAPDMIITAPHCIYNTANSTFSSDGELALRTVDQRLSLEGRGFLFLQRDSRLIVSNDVKTTVRWRALSKRNDLPRPLGVAPASGRNDSTPASTDPETIQISSKQLDYRPELALFEHHVRASETNGLLRSERLAAHFVSNRLERIEVEQAVSIEQGVARATGDRGTFTAAKDKGVARLTGNATWRDNQRSISADTLVLDRVRNIVRGEGQARMKVPRQGLSQAGAVFVLAGAATDKLSDTNSFVELSSDVLTLQLPATNGPVQRIEAERNVVILSPADKSRATGRKAVYDELIGTLELTGDPVFAGSDHLVTGETLVLDRTNRVFSARQNAYVRVPVTALGKSSLLARAPAVQKNAGAATNQFLEVFSDEFDYRTNRMDFRRNVRAHLIEGGLKRGELLCADLKISFGQRLESLLASGGVIARQFPFSLPDGKRVSKELSCETLTATMNADGRLESLLAKQNVHGEQSVIRANNPKPALTKAAADQITARFSPETNRVEKVVAEHNVILEQEGRTAHGGQAVFHGESQVLELTGQPTAISPEGRITEADVLVWDAARQQLRVRGQFKSAWQRPQAVGTNDSALRPARSPWLSPFSRDQ